MAMTVARRRDMPIVIFGVGFGHSWELAQLVHPPPPTTRRNDDARRRPASTAAQPRAMSVRRDRGCRDVRQRPDGTTRAGQTDHGEGRDRGRPTDLCSRGGSERYIPSRASNLERLRSDADRRTQRRTQAEVSGRVIRTATKSEPVRQQADGPAR